MFKKMCLSLALMCGMAVADVGPINPEFKSLLRNDGVMEKNTLKLIPNRGLEASGELIVTGVLVSSLGNLTFYPDKNLKNVLFDANQFSSCGSNCKPSANYPIEVLGDDKLISKALGENIYGTQAVRVKAHFNKFGYEADSGYLILKNIFTLTPVKKTYMTYDPNYNEFAEELGYGSKDSYVNIRQTPKGAIVGQIQKTDFQKSSFQRGIIVCNAKAFQGCNVVNGWYEVFYFPPGKRNGKDAIHGYIHKSQIKGH